jgi:hypothetical protein
MTQKTAMDGNEFILKRLRMATYKILNMIPLIIKVSLGLKLMLSLLFAKRVTVTASVLNQE